MSAPAFYPRSIERRLVEALEDSPVVLIHGPRQCGETTLAQLACAPSQWHSNRLSRPMQTADCARHRLPATLPVS